MQALPQTVHIGIDVGGTKIAACALAADDHQLLFSDKYSTPQDYQALVQTIAEIVAHIELSLQCSASVGVCFPGAIIPQSGLVKNANTTWLNGQAFQQDLETCLKRPIRCNNDANSFALAEAIDGAGRGHSVVFGATLGTGLGGGLVIDQHIQVGRNYIGAEWGHNSMPWPEDNDELTLNDCFCGRKACIETFVSGTGISLDYQRATGQQLTAEAIVERFHTQETTAVDVIKRFEHRLARVLASMINIVDPDVIVLGGGLSHLQCLYENIPDLWQAYVFSPHRIDTPLLPAKHGPYSGMRGAAWLWSTTQLRAEELA